MLKAVLKKYWKLLLSAAVITALGTGILTGLTGSFVSLKNNLDRYIEEYQYPDAVITTQVLSRKRKEDLEKIEGVEYADARLAADTVIESPEGKMLSVRAFSFTENDRQKMHVWSGKVPDGSSDELAAEVLFARNNGIHAGDSVKIRTGDEYRTVTVAGLVSLPEDLSVRENRYASGLNSDFGYLYVPNSALKRETPAEKKEAQEKLSEQQKELEEAKKDAELFYLDVLEKLAEGKKELQDKIAQFRKAEEEMESVYADLLEKEKELLDRQSDVTAKKAELEAKKQDALARQKELRELREQAEELLGEIRDALKEADQKEAELLELKDEAEAKKAEILEKKKEVEEQLQKLREAKEGLRQIDEGIKEAEEAYDRIRDEDVIRAVDLLRMLNEKTRISMISDTAAVILEFAEVCRKYGIVIDIDRPISPCAKDILKVMDQIETDEGILTAENARDLVKKAEDGDETVIHSEEYKKIKASVKHYILLAGTEEITEEQLDQAIEAVEELSELLKDGHAEKLLTVLKDQYGSTLKEFADLLEQDAEGIHTADLDALMGKESRKEAGKALKTILADWKSCGNLLDETAPLETGIPQLLASLRQIEADYSRLQPEAEYPADEVFLRYLRDEEVISEERYELARRRCTRLYDLIQKYHLREIAEKLADYTSWTCREALELAAELKDHARQLEKITETKITTIGELISAFDNADELLKDLIEELKEKRQEIIDQLREAGVEEDELNDYIKEAEQGLKEIDDGLALIEDGLRQIKDGLALIAEKRKEADEAIAEIGEALSEIDDGLRQIEEGLQQAVPLEEEIRSGLTQIEEGLAKIRGGKLEIETGLSESKEKIRTGSAALARQEKEAEEEWAKQLKEFENLEEELGEAFAAMEDAEGYDDLCNQFLIGFADGADPKATLEKCEKVFAGDQIKESYVFEDSDVNRRIHDNTEPIGELAEFMPVVFYIVIMTVVFLFMSILVRMYRREIGIYMALGFSGGSIRGLFSLLGLLVALGSFLPGLGIGWILILMISGYFRDFFPLPFTVAMFDVPMLLPALFVSVIAVQISTWIGTSLISRIHPREAMARFTESPPAVPKILNVLLQPAKELQKYSILTMLRNPLRFLLSVICISATSIMIYSSMSFLTSKTAIIRQLFDNRIRYDCEVYVSEGKEDEFAGMLKGLEYIEACEPSSYYFREIEHDGKTESVLISTLKDNSTLCLVRDSAGHAIPIPERGMVLDRYTAESIGVRIGDKVRVEAAEIEVTGLSDQYINRIQYVSAQQAKDLGEEDLGALLVRMPEEKEQELKRTLSEKDGYLYVIFTHSLRNGFETLYETYDLYAWILVGFAIVIGLLIVLNITAASLIEQKKGLCMFRTLGFSVGEIGQNLFLQSVLRLLFSLVIGIPIAGRIARYAPSAISTDSRIFPYVSGFKELLITGLIVFGYTLISHMLSIQRIRSWDIVEAVKDRE